MSILLIGDCLEELTDIQDNSVDLIFCDLPYGQTSCKWDSIIPIDKLWIEFMRIKKLNTPIIMTTTTKFGLSLLNSCPKKCPFRYDLVWCKSAPCGFLSAKKMPMRKHEMLYVFYEKLPFYDLSSHTHKFIKHKENKKEESKTETYGKIKRCVDGKVGQYDPPLPTSLIKEGNNVKPTDDCYEKNKEGDDLRKDHRNKKYDPPLPTSLIKEERIINNKNSNKGGLYTNIDRYDDVKYDPPLPTSLIKEEGCYGEKVSNKEAKYGQKCARQYEPPLPTSLIKEEIIYDKTHNSDLYGDVKRDDRKNKKEYEPPLPTSLIKEEIIYKKTGMIKDGQIYNGGKAMPCSDMRNGEGGTHYEPPLPTSLVKENENCKTAYGNNTHYSYPQQKNGESIYEPPLPHSLLEIKSTRGKHSTEKPVSLMEWILKYYSKEGDVVLDPTMGSGSMGVACKNMKRNFIGIEKDEEIYEIARVRVEE